MPFSRTRQLRLVACCALVSLLIAGCGDIDTPHTRIATTPSTMTAPSPTSRTSTTVFPRTRSTTRPRSLRTTPPVQGSAADLRLWLNTIAWDRAAARSEAAASKALGRVSGGAVVSDSSVMACIKAHESGDYSEHSHTSDGSGAFQIVPGTWRYWSAKAGYPGYQYAYEAPPAVQDAVVEYMLANGGAGNWSMAYGNDPCTSGLR